ncbi:hypothetical protein PT974_12160 [Cladobotryum mycophilum]|uniref:Uncharacterized protein n=1 Tax=Cladobotryum mycophilum TaxID=491253 RepID=A0ABR0S7S3_9HYPO
MISARLGYLRQWAILLAIVAYFMFIDRIEHQVRFKHRYLRAVISVTERSERNVTKRFDEIRVDWLVVERQLQTWSHLTHNRRKLIIKVTFNYKETKTAGPAGQGSTNGQLAETQARREAERSVLGRTAAWEHVFALFSCPGPPCGRGPYCWQDPNTKKHYKLMGHRFRNLVKSVQRGEGINKHEGMPREIRSELYAEKQQQSSRKRKRANSGSYATGIPAIHIHNIITGQPDTTSADAGVRSTPEVASLRCAVEGLAMRDDVAGEYFAYMVHGLEYRRFRKSMTELASWH